MPRPKKVISTDEMLRASRLFYKDNWNRKQIAAELHTNIPGVTKILKRAQQDGIVRIQIHETAESSLEQAVRTKFPHLQRALIARGGRVETHDQLHELHQKWAVIASDYFNEIYENHPRETPLHVGLTGGEHVLEFVNAVPEQDRRNLHIHVTALVGRGPLSEIASHVDPVVNANILWSHSGRLPGHCEYATVSPYVSKAPGPAARKAVREEIAKVEANRTVIGVVKAMDRLDIAFVGLGIVNPGRVHPVIKSRATMTGDLLENIVTPQQLTREGAVGDISYCLFDERGNYSQKKWQFFLTAGHYDAKRRGVEFFKHMVRAGKRVVAFGGPFQLGAIKVALKSKMFNVWIADEYTARQIADGI